MGLCTSTFKNDLNSTPTVCPNNVVQADSLDISGGILSPSPDISGNSVSNDDISGNSVSNDDISGDSVSNDDISGNSVSNDDISGNSVSNDDISGGGNLSPPQFKQLKQRGELVPPAHSLATSSGRTTLVLTVPVPIERKTYP